MCRVAEAVDSPIRALAKRLDAWHDRSADAGPLPGIMSRILLVEDNELSRDMLSRRLTRRGYEVLTAADGAEAVETARTGTPDLILMDMSLPVIDGWEATRRLKAGPETRAIPIIALTALAMASDERKAREGMALVDGTAVIDARVRARNRF